MSCTSTSSTSSSDSDAVELFGETVYMVVVVVVVDVVGEWLHRQARPLSTPTALCGNVIPRCSSRRSTLFFQPRASQGFVFSQTSINGIKRCLTLQPPHRPMENDGRTRIYHFRLQFLTAAFPLPPPSCVQYLRRHGLKKRNDLSLARRFSGAQDGEQISVTHVELVFFSPRFAGFILSCVGISLAASRGRAIKTSAALLGVV